MRGDIEHQLSQIYEMIIADHVDDIKNIASPEERNIWAANNKATGNVRDYLNNIFQSEYLQDFESNFKGYVPDDTFHATIEQGLDNIKMPEAIGVGIEEMSFDDIKSAISEELLPLLHLDQEHGYESTLNYLDRLHPQERLIENLCDFAVGNSTPNAIATLSFLSRSNLAEEYKNVEILKIKDVLIKLSEIGSLISKEIEVVYTTEPDNLIEACIAKDCPNLFELYCRKIGLSAEELTKGYDDEQLTPLHYAVIHVYDEVVRVILGISGIDTQNLLEAKDINGQTALHLAARRSQANIIKVILETPGVDKQKLLEIQNENGNTALHLAANIGQVEVIKAMLETDGIDKQKLLEIQGEEGYTALHMAVVSGHVGAIKVILEAPGIDTQKLFEIQNRYGKTALQYAMEHNKVDVIKIILHWAAHKGQVEVIKAILETPGVDTQKLLEMQDKQGISMLHLAANEGRVETIKAILETPGVDTQKLLEMQDKQGLTALNWAVDEGQVEAIKVILETPGIDTQKLLKIQNEFGRTAFHTAMYQSNAEAVKAILGTPGIDTQKLLEMKDKQGLTALRLAVYQDRVEALKIILKTPGIDKQELLEMQDEFGRTILHTAAYKGQVEAIKAILETPGVDTQKLLEMQDKQGLTALNWAVDEGQVEAIKVILETPGIDTQKLLEMQDKQGHTALYWAANGGQVEAIKVTLETPGIDTQKLLEIQNEFGRTAFHTAMYQSNAEAVKAILGTPGIDTQKLLEMKDKQGLTALRLAVYQDRVEALKIILKTPGIDKQELLEMQDEFGRTILHTAAYKGHTEAIKTILKTSGIDTQKLLEVQDGRGKTTLHKAAYEGHVEAIKAILKTPRIDKQKLLKIRDKQELLALNLAGYKGHIQAIKVMLETPGIDVQELLEIQHGPGKTLLQQAASEGQVEALKVILETPGIDKQKLFEMQSKFGKTALHWAAYKGHAEAIKVILKTPGIDKQKLFEIRDKQGVTALSWAVREDNVKEIKVLLQHQINIVGLRGNEKKAISFLKPEELQEILKIEFSDELGKANSTIRIERETLVLNAIYDYLKTYGTDISWKSPNAWAGSLNRISDKVNALMGEMQDIGGIAGGVIVQREIDKVIREIIPKPQDQLVDTEGYSREVNSVQQNAHIRLAEVVKENAETMQAIEEPLDEKMRHNVNLEYGKGTAQLKPYAYGGVFEEYYIDAMDKLLALRLQNGLKTSKKKISAIAAQIIKDSYRVADAVETLIVQFEESSAIMPFLVQSSEEPGMHHWVGIVLANNGVEFSITYLDSENGLIIDGLVNPLQELLPESFIAVRRIPLEQQRYNNCGPELVENFIYYLTSSRATQEAAIYVHSLLLENTLLDPVEYVLKISENNKLIGFLSNQVPLGVDRPMGGRALEAKLQQSKALQFNVPDLNVITNIIEPQQIRYQHTEKVSFSYSESSGKSITILHNQVHAQSL